jgi:hypothetical protein
MPGIESCDAMRTWSWEIYGCPLLSQRNAARASLGLPWAALSHRVIHSAPAGIGWLAVSFQWNLSRSPPNINAPWATSGEPCLGVGPLLWGPCWGFLACCGSEAVETLIAKSHEFSTGSQQPPLTAPHSYGRTEALVVNSYWPPRVSRLGSDKWTSPLSKVS